MSQNKVTIKLKTFISKFKTQLRHHDFIPKKRQLFKKKKKLKTKATPFVAVVYKLHTGPFLHFCTIINKLYINIYICRVPDVQLL